MALFSRLSNNMCSQLYNSRKISVRLVLERFIVASIHDSEYFSINKNNVVIQFLVIFSVVDMSRRLARLQQIFDNENYIVNTGSSNWLPFINFP